MAVWPPTLPTMTTGFLAGTYQEQPADNTIRTNMDVGPAKMRRRATWAETKFVGQMILTSTQVDILDTFFVTTLKHGSTTFGGYHPRTGSSATIRFQSAPVYVDMAPLWKTTLNLEIVST